MEISEERSSGIKIDESTLSKKFTSEVPHVDKAPTPQLSSPRPADIVAAENKLTESGDKSPIVVPSAQVVSMEVHLEAIQKIRGLRVLRLAERVECKQIHRAYCCWRVYSTNSVIKSGLEMVLQLRQDERIKATSFLLLLRGALNHLQLRMRSRALRTWQSVVASQRIRLLEFRQILANRCWPLLNQLFKYCTRRTNSLFIRWFVETRSSRREMALIKEVGNLRESNHAFKRQLLMKLSEPDVRTTEKRQQRKARIVSRPIGNRHNENRRPKF